MVFLIMFYASPRDWTIVCISKPIDSVQVRYVVNNKYRTQNR